MTMIVAKCPLRISLVGGSTDLDAFISKYGIGSVISFPCDLYCYISVHFNNRDKYFVNYSHKEETETIEEIKNDVARVALKYFDIKPGVTITFNTDVLTDGSGLAASSAYMIACVKALSMYKGINLTNFEVCRIALDLERTFNPLTGYQDAYGCGMSGFKRIDFHKDKRPSFRYFNTDFITEQYDMYLVHTGITRSSTEVLKSVNVDKSFELLSLVDDLEKSLNENNHERFLDLMNVGWAKKKNTSKLIANDKAILNLEKSIINYVDGIKLCGAGGGGFFFVLCSRHLWARPDDAHWHLNQKAKTLKVGFSETGVVGYRL